MEQERVRGDCHDKCVATDESNCKAVARSPRTDCTSCKPETTYRGGNFGLPIVVVGGKCQGRIFVDFIDFI